MVEIMKSKAMQTMNFLDDPSAEMNINKLGIFKAKSKVKLIK